MMIEDGFCADLGGNMRRAMGAGLLLALAISCMLAVSGCKQDPKTAILGKWHDDSSGRTVEFLGDGTVTIKGVMNIAGTYSFPDSTHLKLDLGGSMGKLTGPMVFEYTISPDLLNVTDQDGKLTSYKRVQ
jgi:hypothetical protein